MSRKIVTQLWSATTLALILSLLVAPFANAAVWTDLPDYAPGSIVTISGGNDENGAPGYWPGAPVYVSVSGPHDPAVESSTCQDIVVGEDGAWLCTLTLWADPDWAVGSYVYIATSVTADGSPIIETGTFIDALTITGVSPNSGPTTGDTAVTITGTNFTSGQAPFSVTFGGVAATDVTRVDNTHLTAITPAHAAEIVDVVVTDKNNSATLQNGYTYGKTIATVTLSNLTQTYSGSPLTPTGATVPAGLAIVWTNAPQTNAGSYPVTATINDDNYQGSASGTFTIDKAPSTTTVSGDGTFIYDGLAHAATVTVTGAGGLNLTPAPVYSGACSAAPVNVADTPCTASYNFAGDNNHNGSEGSATIDITQAGSLTTVTVSDAIFDGSPHGGTAVATGVGGLSQNLTVIYSGRNVTAYGPSTTPPTNVGDYTASASFSGDANHTGSTDSKNFSIGKAPSTVTVTCPASVVYDGSEQTPCTAEATGVGMSNVDMTASLVYAENTNAGTATADASWDGDDNHFGSTGSGSFVITKAASAVTVSCGGPYVYTGSAQTPCSAVVTGPGGLNEALSVSYANNVNAGTATASASWGGDANHTGNTGSGSFEITKADATCTVIGYTGTYDGTAHGASGTCTGVGSDGILSGLDLGDSFTDVPGGTANWKFDGGTNYKDQSGKAAIVISKADATCSVSGYSGVYDAAAHGASGSCSGIGGESAGTLDLGATFKDVPGGTAHWAFTGNGNYNDQSGDVAIVITKADAGCTVTPYDVVYDHNSHTATGSCTGVGGDGTLSGLDLSSTTHTNPGDYLTDPWTFTDVTGNYKNASGTVHDNIHYATGGTCYGGPGHSILQPINVDGSSVFKQKSTVPAKFRVCDAFGNSVGTPGVVTSFNPAKIESGTVVPIVTESVDSTTPDTAFRWSASDQQWIFNINTKNQTANKTYYYVITLNDGSRIEFHFGLK